MKLRTKAEQTTTTGKQTNLSMVLEEKNLIRKVRKNIAETTERNCQDYVLPATSNSMFDKRLMARKTISYMFGEFRMVKRK